MLPNCCCEPDCTPQNEVCVSWGLDWLAEPNSFFAQCPIGPTTVDFSLIDIVGFDEDNMLQLTYPCEFFHDVSCGGNTATLEPYPTIIQTDAIVPFTKILTSNNQFYPNFYEELSSTICPPEFFIAVSPYIFDTNDPPLWFNGFDQLNCRNRPNSFALRYYLHKAKFYGTIEPTIISLDSSWNQWKCGQSCVDYYWDDEEAATWDTTDSRAINLHVNDGVIDIQSNSISACRNSARPWFTNWQYYSPPFGYGFNVCDCGNNEWGDPIIFDYAIFENSKMNSPHGFNTFHYKCNACSNPGGHCSEISAFPQNGWTGNVPSPCTQESSHPDCTDTKIPGDQTWVDKINPFTPVWLNPVEYYYNISTFDGHRIYSQPDLLIGHAFFFEPSSSKCLIRQEFSLSDQGDSTSSLSSVRKTLLTFGKPTSGGYSTIDDPDVIYLKVISDWHIENPWWLAAVDDLQQHIIYCGFGGNGNPTTPDSVEIIIDNENYLNVTSLSIEIERFMNHTLNNKIKKIKYFVNDNLVYEHIYPSNFGMKLCNSTPIESIASIVTGDFVGYNNSLTGISAENFFYCFYGGTCNYPYGINCERYLNPDYSVSPHQYTISSPTMTWS